MTVSIAIAGDRVRGIPSLRRRHLFEWGDARWLPAVLRRFMTDHLAFHARWAFPPVAPVLGESLRRTGYEHIVDLCSGGGGPFPALLPILDETAGHPHHVTLTDLHPDPAALRRARACSGEAIDYLEEPVDALACPDSPSGYRTLFTALHHFNPDEVRGILGDAAARNVPIAAFEVQERTPLSLVTLPLAMLLSSFVLTPFLPRCSARRLFFTYVLPLAPLCFAWDTFVSCWRTYTPAELATLAASLDREGYRWRTGSTSARGYIGRYRISWIIGEPVP
ncbi:class I SAM-dependent methyltransferase [Halofilum ochraceum]|uniref:class I SAM-dependent methyltransferase n=1 Tax=Halofilum ochraceum TaxID=1611323 RepID=UPI0008D987AE|nr:class I SAM-dependent methyltransferase [Halofilum ochraceum]